MAKAIKATITFDDGTTQDLVVAPAPVEVDVKEADGTEEKFVPETNAPAQA